MVTESVTQAGVGRNAPCHSHFADAGVGHSAAQFVHQNINDSGLQRGAEIGLVLIHEVRIVLQRVAEGVEERRFESAETVIVARDVWLAKGEGPRIALVGQAIDDGAAGITEAHHLGALVEGFARGVVDRLPDDLHAIVGLDADDLRVAARDE